MKPANISTNTKSLNSSELLSTDQILQLYELAEHAGIAILDIYQDESLWQHQSKADSTPVTAADLRSSDILVQALPNILDCPVVSEEALPSYSERKDWSVYWLVDPLDGTREFVQKTDEFVINIALMKNHQPVFGMIYRPTTAQAWWGGIGIGAFKGSPTQAVELAVSESSQSLIALGSRRSKWLGDWRQALNQAGYSFQTKSVGSALKFALLAEGAGDLYPRLGLTSEWDTAAPQAILTQTGGAIVQWDGKPIVYGKENTLNPYFVAVRDKALLKVVINPASE